MKKILILGSASVHVKLIEAAQEMGIYTITTDNISYDDSPGKKVADEYWDINIYDVDVIVDKARTSGVNGVICGWLDPAQRPYREICERLNLPCYGNEQQFITMTDKHEFKKMCINNGIDIIPEYSLESFTFDDSRFPVFVKPVDSRGSRGQTIVHSFEQLQGAVANAKKESTNGDILIEKYMGNANEFQVTYFFVDGEPILLRTCDSYVGNIEHKLDKVVACSVSPSKFTDIYISTAHNKVVECFKKMGIKYGPIFMQGFEDNGIFRFFDPGLRFPGVDYDRIYSNVFDINIMKAMIDIAISGKCNITLPSDGVYLKGKRAAILFPTVKAGTINHISGSNQVKNMKEVISYLPRYKEADVVEWSYNVNQRLCEIDILSDDTESLKDTLRLIEDTLKPFDQNLQNMMYEYFDVARIK